MLKVQDNEAICIWLEQISDQRGQLLKGKQNKILKEKDINRIVNYHYMAPSVAQNQSTDVVILSIFKYF